MQVSIEAMIDICNHIISRKNFRIPDNSADAFRVLNEESLIPDEKLPTYIAMARFRNRVVYLYDSIDEKEIYRIIKEHLVDFDYFIKLIVREFLSSDK